MKLSKLQHVSFAIFLILFVFILILAILTYVIQSSTNPLFALAIQNHLIIMIILALSSVGFGFFWSIYLSKEITQQNQQNINISNLMLKFLSQEERIIVEHLMKKSDVYQSELSKIQGLNKVKVHRNLQKLKNKNIVTVKEIGKARIININSDLELNS